MKRVMGSRQALLLALGTMFPSEAAAQVAAEVPAPDIAPAFREVTDLLGGEEEIDAASAIARLRRSLDAIDDPRERFDIVMWELAFRYAELERYSDVFDVLRSGQREGVFCPLGESARPFGREIRRLEGYATFESENTRLLEAAQMSAVTEYFVKLPEGYTERRAYPLVMVFHGGWGSNRHLPDDWQSERLQSELIVAYLQGSVIHGTNLRSYVEGDDADLVEAYHRITRDYAVDTTQVVLAGQSAGGARSINLALSGSLPASRLLLAFPVVPRGISESAFAGAKATGWRVSIVAGEHDWGLARQKVFSVKLDEHEMPNRFVIFPEVGHGFPPGFSEQIDLSLDFLFPKGH